MKNDIKALHNKIAELERKIKRYEQLLIENNINFNNEHAMVPYHQTELSTQEKLSIYTSYFKGRNDCYAIRWEKGDGSGYAPSYAKEVRYLTKEERKKIPFDKLYEPFNEKVIFRHLKGIDTIGIYPVLDDQTCFFLAFDFDEDSFKKDVINFSHVCTDHKIDHLIEISRSGKGAHLWIFFESPVLAKEARKLGRYLLTKTMMTNGLKTFKSYDRMFPAQDFIKKDGIGNLIALPLQGRSGLQGNTLFVDNEFTPYSNQYQKIKNTKKTSAQEFKTLLEKISKENEIGFFNESIRKIELDILDFPSEFDLIIENQIHITQNQLSAKAIQYFKRMASVVNPEFYKKQSMRVSTYGISRIIELYEETNDKLLLPIGVLEHVKNGLGASHISFRITDLRVKPKMGEMFQFLGSLTNEQQEVLQEIVKQPHGVLIAPTGFGKTVLGINLIFKLKLKTLIIVNRVNLAEQWANQINKFTSCTNVGKLYGKDKKMGFDIDIATIQSLTSYDNLDDITKHYGLIIIDEAHHLASVSYEKLIRKFHAKHIIGLTATLKRSDGLENIITTMIGPVIKEVAIDSKRIKRKLTIKLTGFKLDSADELFISDAYQRLYENKERNEMILEDIKNASKMKKNILVLTDRIQHIEMLEKEIKTITNHLFVIHGQLTIKAKKTFNERLKHQKEPFIILATGKYIGEGFDDCRLDTLFLTMPFRWKGTLQQYVGRLNRENHNKQEIQVYDYADIGIKYFSNMYLERLKGYRKMGYEISTSKLLNSSIYDGDDFEQILTADLEAAKDISFIVKFANESRIKALLKCCSVTPKVVEGDDCPANIIIIDNHIVWYGSINPFAYKQQTNSEIMRYEDRMLARELMCSTKKADSNNQ